jgi:hypothetical protein
VQGRTATKNCCTSEIAESTHAFSAGDPAAGGGQCCCLAFLHGALSWVDGVRKAYLGL